MRPSPERWDPPVDRVGRRTLLRAGLTTGFGVVALGAAGLSGAAAPPLEARSFLRQTGWRHCKNCQGLSYADALTSGRCPNPKDGVPYHRADGSLKYFLSYSTAGEQETADRQNLWRHCKNCQGLAYNGQGLLGWCPAGGHHDHTGSHDYFLWHGAGRPYSQSGWRFCDKCMALFYGPAEAASWCGKSGQHHAPGEPHPSFPYLLEYDCESPNGCR
jgi:hypothetical protein